MKKFFTAAMLLAMTTITANAQDEQQYTHLVINELMQSNVECTMDDIHEFPDSWVELYNPTGATINLKDYKISNKNKDNNAWVLPNKEIPAGGYVVIYCDKEARTDKRLHTDFRLESGDGGKLYLFTGGVIVDKLEGMAKMPAPDVAYGRAKNGQATDNGDTWGYELNPTPGEPNSGGVVAASQILGAPVFSELGRVTSGNDAITLELSLPDVAPKGTVICYTTDGSEPKAIFNPETNCFESTGSSVLCDDEIEDIEIVGTTVVRAKLFHKDYLSPVSTAQSYIFHPRTMTVPIFSVLTKDAYLYDAEIGLFANNNSKEDKKLHDWRRPVNIEMFTKEGEGSKIIFNQLGETRIQGGQSRANALKSMVFYANKRFDPDHNRFIYQFFPDQKPGVTEFKSFSLRDGGNDFGSLYFRDLIIQRTMGPNTDLDWQAGHTAVLYINGQYMGMLNIRERSNEDNIYSNYKNNKNKGLEDIDMIEISHERGGVVNHVVQDLFIEELKEGTDSFYNAFKEFYSQTGHTLAEYEEKLDVSEYLNVMILNLFYGNIDFPGNNIVFWRPNKDAKTDMPKRFRVIVKDTDYGLGLYGWKETKSSFNTIHWIYDRETNYDGSSPLYRNFPYDGNSSYRSWAFTEPATELFRNMMGNQKIKDLFIDKSCVYMGDFMNAEGTSAVIDAIKEEALDEFAAHRVKYNGYDEDYHRNDITNRFNDAKNWLKGYTEYDRWGSPTATYLPRTDYFYDYISSQWNLGTPIPVTINKNVDATESPNEVYVNGIKLTKGVFDGKLFQGRLITLEAKNNIKNDYSVTGWEIKKNGVSEEPVEGTTYNFTVPSCTKLEINAVRVHKPQVTIGQYGAVSFSSTQPLDFTGLPIKAYIVTAKNGSKFMKKQVFKVPAETGLVIEGPEYTYKIPVACANAAFDDVSDNMLKPTATQAFTVPKNLEGRVYGLFYSYDQQKVGFKKKEANYTFGIGKSYLLLPGQQAEANINELFFDETIDGIATDIQGANNNTWTDGQIYNLNGQRVDKNYNGVIIVNGKKVVNNRK